MSEKAAENRRISNKAKHSEWSQNGKIVQWIRVKMLVFVLWIYQTALFSQSFSNFVIQILDDVIILYLCIRHLICHSVHTSNISLWKKFDLIFVKAMIYTHGVWLNWKILQSHVIKILLIVYVFHWVVRIPSAKSSYYIIRYISLDGACSRTVKIV